MTKVKKEGVVPIHGKEYKTVALRVAEFRQEHPEATIASELISADDQRVVMKSTISIGGNVIATGWAEEQRNASNINKTSALENCETSCVGRALAFFGMAGEELQIASADEVVMAKNTQAHSEWIAYNAAVREHWDWIQNVKSCIANVDWDGLAGCWNDIKTEGRNTLLTVAPSNGGIFETHERTAMKSDDFFHARKRNHEG